MVFEWCFFIFLGGYIIEKMVEVGLMGWIGLGWLVS